MGWSIEEQARIMVLSLQERTRILKGMIKETMLSKARVLGLDELGI